jgi:hypothetical protein
MSVAEIWVGARPAIIGCTAVGHLGDVEGLSGRACE